MKIQDILFEAVIAKHVVVFPGRFQPMMPHHVQVFQQLQTQFSGAEVYFATSDKQGGPEHPFSRDEKKMVAARLYGVDPERIISVTSPYNHASYAGLFDGDRTQLTFALGAKDGNRLVGSSRDPETGLALKKNGEPAHIQPFETSRTDPLPLNQRTYVHVVPTVKDADGASASATAFRSAFGSATDDDAAREVFERFLGKLDEPTFQMMSERLRGGSE